MAQIMLRISYDGTDYHGFQSQAHGVTIQSTLESAMSALLGPGRLVGASRTDSGVHAEDQIVAWDGPCPLPLARLGDVLNRRLPVSIRVMAVGLVPDGWDPRRAASAKFYRYQIWRGPVPGSFARMVHRVDYPLSWSLLQQTAAWFEGVHDFRSFRSSGSSARTTTRNVYTSRWEMAQAGSLWIYRVGANGFLYHMVRLMVGAMLEAAKKGRTDRIRAALENPGAFTQITTIAPAGGLVLERIEWQGRDCFVPEGTYEL
ncbi:MAG: tRNA pseudouridine(38-40) synthase TruA [Sulfobacillus sp.]